MVESTGKRNVATHDAISALNSFITLCAGTMRYNDKDASQLLDIFVGTQNGRNIKGIEKLAPFHVVAALRQFEEVHNAVSDEPAYCASLAYPLCFGKNSPGDVQAQRLAFIEARITTLSIGLTELCAELKYVTSVHKSLTDMAIRD